MEVKSRDLSQNSIDGIGADQGGSYRRSKLPEDHVGASNKKTNTSRNSITHLTFFCNKSQSCDTDVIPKPGKILYSEALVIYRRFLSESFISIVSKMANFSNT